MSYSRIQQQLLIWGRILYSMKTPIVQAKKEEVTKRFSYEIKDWIVPLGSYPKELIATGDHSRSYEQERLHVFKLENNRYATVHESGCSCYDPTWAGIELFPTKKAAIEKFERWDKQHQGEENEY